MRSITKCILSLGLLFVLTILLLPCTPAKAAIPDMEYYTNYGTITKLYNINSCTGMQGMTVDNQYLYNVKVNSSTEDNAFIARTHKDTGSTVYLTNSATGTSYFSYLGHANDLEIDTIAGVDTMFIATSTTGNYSLVRMALNGTTLTKIGNYTTSYNGSATAISSAKVMYKNDTEITLLIKKGKYLYTTTLGVNDTSGTLKLEHVFTLDTAHVTINGVTNDFSDYLGQGFDYFDGKIFVPMACADPITKGCIAVYQIEGASGTIRNDPSLSFWITSSTYTDKFELESCAICPTDGVLYFNTNAATTSSGDHDGIHYVKDYVYDPAKWTTEVGSYRWEVRNNTLTSVIEGPTLWNNAMHHCGSISGNTFTDGRYALSKSIILNHDVPWIVEWKSSGKWTDGALLFSSASASKNEGNRYLFRRKDSTLIALGEYSDGTFYNYGLTLSDYGIDGTAEHVYTLYNRINDDGSNMVYLAVDGKELGSLTNYHIAGTSQGTTSNWVNGKDFSFSYLGTDQHPVDDCGIEYIQVWANGLLSQADEPNNYRWDTVSDTLTAYSEVGHTENNVSALSGSCSNGSYTDTQYQLDRSVILLHDRPWSIEWCSEGAWSGGSLLLSAGYYSQTANAPILYRRQNSTLISLGYYDGNRFNNYGINLSNHGIDGTVKHTYRLTNRIHEDGSNMVYLFVDGKELGPMNNYHIGGTSQNTTSDWLNGQDLSFSYLGTYDMPINDCSLEYLQIWEAGIPADAPANHYLWETKNDQLISNTDSKYTSNTAGVLSGSTSNGIYTGSHFALDTPVFLCHDRSWFIEWESSGNWKDNANGTLLLSSAISGNDEDATYLYRRGSSEIIAFGERLNAKHHNYGIKLSDHGIDGTVNHTYRIENRLHADGSNMAYLLVDGIELGAMNNYYIAGNAQNTTSNWISGKDFMFSYFGAQEFHIGNCSISYLEISENAVGTVEFRNWDGTLISSTEYAYGDSINIPASPTREPDQMYSYSFAGWDKPVVPCNGDAVYTAVFSQTYIPYTVQFVDWDGTVLSSKTYRFGDTVVQPNDPAREDDQIYTYTFIGWDPVIGSCSGDAVYTAQYSAERRLNPSITPKYPTLSFEDEVLINAYFTGTDLDGISLTDMGLIIWSTPQTTGTIENAEAITRGATYNADIGFYCVTTTGIPAKNLGDNLYFKIYVHLPDGSYLYSALLDYSPKTYAMNTLASAASSAELKALVVAMMNYGAQAQTYFNYKSYNLVNANLSEAQRSLVDAYRPDMVAGVVEPSVSKIGAFSATSTGFSRKYPTVSFEGAFSINYYFRPVIQPADGMRLYYWHKDAYEAASVLTPENVSGVEIMTAATAEDGSMEYTATVAGIAAKNLEDTLYVAAVYTDGTNTYCSGVLAYSIGTYCTIQAGGSTAMQPFAAATAVYGYYARCYFNIA